MVHSDKEDESSQDNCSCVFQSVRNLSSKNVVNSINSYLTDGEDFNLFQVSDETHDRTNTKLKNRKLSGENEA